MTNVKVTAPSLSSPPVDPRIRAAAEGDRAAAHGLLSELLPRVRNLVRYLVRGDSEVDDITQQVLLELLRSFRTYMATGSLQSWTDRITVRVTLRRRKRVLEELARRQTMARELHAVAAPESASDDYVQRRQMADWLDALPAEQRQALVLHHVVGMSVKEISEELGISGETIRSRLRLAVGKLRSKDANDGGRP